ncbi:RWP-RK domain-containing protein, partial [Reticulomyxa filosa]
MNMGMNMNMNMSMNMSMSANGNNGHMSNMSTSNSANSNNTSNNSMNGNSNMSNGNMNGHNPSGYYKSQGNLLPAFAGGAGGGSSGGGGGGGGGGGIMSNQLITPTNVGSANGMINMNMNMNNMLGQSSRGQPGNPETAINSHFLKTPVPVITTNAPINNDMSIHNNPYLNLTSSNNTSTLVSNAGMAIIQSHSLPSLRKNTKQRWFGENGVWTKSSLNKFNQIPPHLRKLNLNKRSCRKGQIVLDQSRLSPQVVQLIQQRFGKESQKMDLNIIEESAVRLLEEISSQVLLY